ncbi:uncharacterized protein LOC113227359 [Hyposmocoma kahamanoa]|uniref:uncharacterized protein LOC113227359 n=1 Tax=Hyposmocoma kahamanoa TaxID=1477025 RepID=UPI000E6D7A2C|nr:uncharacterized protein LOC113227359 [Hyposmocoma kahamanoa]
MNKQFQIIDEQLKNISNEVHEVHQNAIHLFYFTANAVALDVILSNLRRIQETVINTVTNIYHGRLDIHLLAPEQLQNQLNIISRQVQGQHLAPVDANNIKEVSKILRVKARVTEQYVIIEVKIPLLGTDSYELNKVIPIHQHRKNRYVHITPASEYIAFNLRKDTFMSLTELDLQNCIKYNEQKLLCPLSSPLYELRVDQSICDVKIMNDNSKETYCRSEIKDCADRWMKLQTRDTWLFTCCEECKVRILCPSGVATACLQYNGLINIGQDCVLKGDTFTIQGHHDYISQLYTDDYNTGEIFPNSTLNTLVNSSIARIPFVVESHNITLWKLKQQIQELQQQKEIISNDDIHHYTMIYIVFSVVIVAIAIGTTWLCKRKSREDPRGNLQQQQLPTIVVSAPPPRSNEPGSADKTTSPLAKHRTIHFKTIRGETV